MQECYDYVVIGGGSAGSVIGSRLSAAGASVLMLEAGGSDRRLDVIIPGLVARAYKKVNWKYPVEPDPSRTNAPEAWMAGKVMGGGGSINSCVYVRGNRADFDGWANHGCTGWDYESVLPSFKRMETWEGGGSVCRGSDGPINVGMQTDRGVANQAFFDAARQAGHQANDDYNAAQQDGVSILQVNHRQGRRSQSSKEYLQRIASKNRITVRTRAFVTRILFESKRATGVEYLRDGRIEGARVNVEVILSAGAIASPKILLLSGVGPRSELGKFGIDVVANVPGVGANLQEHPQVIQRWLAKGVRTMNKMGVADMLKGLGDYLFHRTGFLAMTAVQMQVMAKTDSSLRAPNLQLCFAPFAISRESDENGMFDVKLAKEEGFFGNSILLNPQARGSISLRSALPTDLPIINLRFLELADDVRNLTAGLHEMRRVMSQPAMLAITNGPMQPEASCETKADWERFLRYNTTTTSHPVGTCKMGIDDMSVVDSALCVRDVRGLRVVDASIMPTITSGNTNVPAMMIGERASDFVLNHRRI